MDLDDLPVQFKPLLQALAGAVRTREPAIRATVERIRAENPDLPPEEQARVLIRGYRRRVASTGAASGATALIPGLGTLVALGTVTSQGLYALEQETELALAIGHLFGHEPEASDRRILEALVVVGIAGGAVKLRDQVIVEGGRRLTGHFLDGMLTRLAGRRVLSSAGRLMPLAVGMVVGAGFDWFAVTALGTAAIRYYGPGGPGAVKPVPIASLPPVEDRREVEPRG